MKPNPEKSIFELRKVELRNENGNSYQILSGLQKGNEIVINGTFTVDAAAQLQGKLAIMGIEETLEIALLWTSSREHAPLLPF